MSETSQKIGDRIRELRENVSRKSQKEIAKGVGIHRDVYARYERGERELPIEILIKLSKLYGVSADYILGIEESKTANPLSMLPPREKDRFYEDQLGLWPHSVEYLQMLNKSDSRLDNFTLKTINSMLSTRPVNNIHPGYFAILAEKSQFKEFTFLELLTLYLHFRADQFGVKNTSGNIQKLSSNEFFLIDTFIQLNLKEKDFEELAGTLLLSHITDKLKEARPTCVEYGFTAHL